MIRRRLAAFALSLLTFAGCHEDPNVQQVTVSGAASALAIFTNGGTSSMSNNLVGTGKNGGAITARVLGELNLGGSTTIAALTVPPTPTGTVPSVPVTGGFSGPGNVTISGTINLIPALSVTFQSTTGDLIISGSLRTTDAGGSQAKVFLDAPNGTVYVTGSIVTSSSDGTASGDRGGDVTITAARIVVTGTINTQGEAGVATGGRGGDVSMTSSSGGVIVTGTILTSGGAATTAGRGGDVLLTAANQLQLFGPVTANGGVANDATVKPVGGTAGNVTLSGAGGVDVSSVINQRGGNATGANPGADGGNGGAFSVNVLAAVKIYGTLDLRGGTASVTTTGPLTGTLIAGAGGAIDLGNTGPVLASLELGRGTWSTIGGSGVDAVGDGGAIDLQTEDGNITFGSDLDTHGGSATGVADVIGGIGGAVTILGDATANTRSNHPLTANFNASVTATGGAGSGLGNGGVGGNVTFQSGGDITLPIVIATTGGAADDGTGGKAGTITVTVSSTLGTPAVGDVLMSGVLTAQGGTSSNGPGGDGAAVTVNTTDASPGEITSSADITTSGANGLLGTSAGGLAADVKFETNLGNITLSGTITANGGSSINTTRPGGSVDVKCGVNGGSIISSAAINVLGGSSLAISTPAAGALGGNVTFTILSTSGSIQLSTGTAIVADGGNATSTATGGGGGIVTLLTVDQSVSISGTIFVQGGDSTGGDGGLGGQVVVNTDTNTAAPGGDITLNSNGSIDVSGGTGTGSTAGAGDARNNGGTPPDTATAPLAIAVIFDADGNLATTPDNPAGGIVRNLGSIVARGRGPVGNGGDIWFDGRPAGGVGDLAPADAGTQNRTGIVAGDFSPN